MSADAAGMQAWPSSHPLVLDGGRCPYLELGTYARDSRSEERLQAGSPDTGGVMTRYLISFDDGAMSDIPDEDWPAVGEASHAVVREARDAGVRIFGGGVERQQATVVAPDGAVAAGSNPRRRQSSAASPSSTCRHARRRLCGPPRSPWAAAAHRRFGRSWSTRSARRARNGARRFGCRQGRGASPTGRTGGRFREGVLQPRRARSVPLHPALRPAGRTARSPSLQVRPGSWSTCLVRS